MSVTFTKLFSSITASTVWCEDPETKIVWITMLAMADRKGRVWASIPGLAAIARVTLEGCERAIEKFSQPDRYSRTKEHEGRRIEEIDGGWRLLNYDKYRAVQDDELRKEYKREWIANKRNVDKSVDNVDKCDTGTHQYTQAEAEAEAEADKEKNKRESRRFTPPSLDEVRVFMKEKNRQGEAERFFNHYESNGWKVGKNPMKNWKAAAAQWLTRDFSSGHGKVTAPVVTGWLEERDLFVGPRGRIYDIAKQQGKSFGSQQEFDDYAAEILRKVRA